MIQANELRIGNYVMFCGNIEQVTVISEDEIKCSSYGHPAMLEPVSLTDEILEKCGFKDGVLERFCVLNNGDIVFNGYCHDYSGINFGRIKYLHQLQNIYFALTGKELNFNTHEDSIA